MRQPPTVLWAQLAAPGEPAQQLSVASGFPAFQNCQPVRWASPPNSASTCTLETPDSSDTVSTSIQTREKAAPTHGEMICTKCSDQCLDS